MTKRPVETSSSASTPAAPTPAVPAPDASGHAPRDAAPSAGPSVARLRAQRANAQRSTGPRTVRGRLRSAVNGLRLRIAPDLRRHLERRGENLTELQRLWQDLAAIFWFVDPVERYGGLQFAASQLWSKRKALRNGGSEAYLRSLDARIEEDLTQLLYRYACGEPNWKRRVCKEIGPDAVRGSRELREAVEARLGVFSHA
jgi:hypothetical protein